MNNTIRCCISCILPCGSLDVIRIVHTSGHVEEIRGTVLASEIMKANPRHVLKKHASYNNEGDVAEYPKVMILSPNVELQRGKIYFLVPTHIPSTTKKTRPMPSSSSTSLKKIYYRRSGHDVVTWKPYLKSISEATSYA